MISRTAGLRRGQALRIAAALFCVTTMAVVHAQSEPGADGLVRLKTGNARFVNDASEALPITTPRRAALAQGQSPFATVLSCSDSRVPPEVVFHTGLGDLFVVRAAGHVPDRSVLASLEYGAERMHIPLLVVMGHESCGVVKAALDAPSSNSAGPNLDYLLKSIRPAVSRTAGQPENARLRAAILANVEETINQLLDTSAVLKRLAQAQQLTLVGAYYELASGRVHFSEPVHVLPNAASSSSSSSRSVAPAAPTTSHSAPVAPASKTAPQPNTAAPAQKTVAAVNQPAATGAPTTAGSAPAAKNPPPPTSVKTTNATPSATNATPAPATGTVKAADAHTSGTRTAGH